MKDYSYVRRTLTDMFYNTLDRQRYSEICADVLDAVRKQIPKRGIMKGDEYSSVLSCPSCRKPIVNVWSNKKYEPNYCHYCGQKLLWGE